MIRPVAPPGALRRQYEAWSWSPAWVYDGAVTVWRLTEDGGGRVRFLKVRAVEEEPRLTEEAARLAWACAHLPVPEVVAFGTEADMDWLLLAGLPGRDATDPELKADPATLVPVLARGLRRFHELAPVDGCPFRLTIGDAIAAVERRIREGKASVDDLHADFHHLGLDDLVPALRHLAPQGEDLVVCHGDYCFPNVLVEDGRVTAYLDLGELAVADRWWDVAVGAWSTTWNVGAGWEQLFYDSYGIEPDAPRITFYRLLYDLIS